MVSLSRSVELSGLALEMSKGIVCTILHINLRFHCQFFAWFSSFIIQLSSLILYWELGDSGETLLSVCTFACVVLTRLAILISDINTARWVVLVIDKHVYSIYGLSIAERQKMIIFINCFDITRQGCKTLNLYILTLVYNCWITQTCVEEPNLLSWLSVENPFRLP